MERLFTTNREEFVHFIDFLKDMIFVMEVVSSNEFRYLILNRAAKERLKVTDDDIQGKRLEDVMNEENAHFIKNKYRNVLEKREQLSYEYSIGDNRFEESILNPIINKNNELTHIISITRDTSQRKRTEIQLKESEERYRLIAENSKALIQLLSTDGYITYASPSHLHVLNIPPEDLINEPLEKYIPLRERKIVNEAINKLNNSKVHLYREIKITSQYSNEIYLSVNFIPIFDSANEYIKQILVVAEDITERKEYEKKIHQMAYYDHLTGLPNNQLLQQLFQDAIDYAKDNDSEIALLYIDCDHFKLINDTYGHGVGDLFLQDLSQRLEEVIATHGGIASRIGGDEFNIVLKNINKRDKVNQVLERLYEEMEKPWIYEGNSIPVRISIGISLYPIDGTDIQTLVKKADAALYRAKSLGKNRYIFFTE